MLKSLRFGIFSKGGFRQKGGQLPAFLPAMGDVERQIEIGSVRPLANKDLEGEKRVPVPLGLEVIEMEVDIVFLFSVFPTDGAP